MAMQTSGAITLAQIQTEFGGSNPIGLAEYSFADPFKIVNFQHTANPATTIGVNEFYGSSVRTARITSSANNDSYPRYGMSQSNGYFYYQSESGQSGSAFGGSTRTVNLATGSRELACMVMVDDTYYDGVTIGFKGSNASTEGGWTRIEFYTAQTSSPYRPNSTGQYATLYRTDRSGFGALPGTSPTTYAYRWYTNSQGNSDVTDVKNLIKNVATGSSPNYFYVKFF